MWGGYDYEDIGIAWDETDRQGQLSESMRSILCEEKITEADAYLYCQERGLLSPHYLKYKRDGCALCPNTNEEVREEWFRQYPEACDLVIALQNIAIRERPEQNPLRDHQWFIWQSCYPGYQFKVEDLYEKVFEE